METSIPKLNQLVFQRFVRVLIMLGLFLLGAVIIGRFLNWGEIDFGFLDWTQEGPRYLFIQNSILQRKWPLFIDSPMIESERFLGIPDTLLVPQNILLRFLPIGQFILLNTLVNYSLGFYGMVQIKKRLNWSLGTFLIITPLILLNGFILSHLAVGHSMWVNAFLIPWFVLLILDFPVNRNPNHWYFKYSLFILFIFLQGGFHFVLWCWGFTLLYALSRKSSVRFGLQAVIISAFASMIRILPAIGIFYETERKFIAGFRTLDHLIGSLIRIQLPEEPFLILNSGLPVWETNFYIGILGSFVLIVFGLVLPLIRKVPDQKLIRFWLPIFVMTFLSIGQIFRFTNVLPLPLVHAERVSSRFFYLPLIFLLLIAGENLNLWLDRIKLTPQKLLLLGGAIIINLHDLIQNARLWRVDRIKDLFSNIPIPLIGDVVAKNDPQYITAIIVGSIVTVITITILILLKKQNKTAEPGSTND